MSADTFATDTFTEEAQTTDRKTRLLTGISLAGKFSMIDMHANGLYRCFYEAYAISMNYGAKKYDYGNFEASPATELNAIDSCLRHLVALKSGEVVDEESGLPHICPVVTRLALAIVKYYRKILRDLTTTCPTSKSLMGVYDVHSVKELHKFVMEKGEGKFIGGWNLPKGLPLPSATHVPEEVLSSLSKNIIWEKRDDLTVVDWLILLRTYLLEWLLDADTSDTITAKQLINGYTKLDLSFWCAINALYQYRNGSY